MKGEILHTVHEKFLDIFEELYAKEVEIIKKADNYVLSSLYRFPKYMMVVAYQDPARVPGPGEEIIFQEGTFSDYIFYPDCLNIAMED